jgi:hypothetical protein
VGAGQPQSPPSTLQVPSLATSMPEDASVFEFGGWVLAPSSPGFQPFAPRRLICQHSVRTVAAERHTHTHKHTSYFPLTRGVSERCARQLQRRHEYGGLLLRQRRPPGALELSCLSPSAYPTPCVGPPSMLPHPDAALFDFVVTLFVPSVLTACCPARCVGVRVVCGREGQARSEPRQQDQAQLPHSLLIELAPKLVL